MDSTKPLNGQLASSGSSTVQVLLTKASTLGYFWFSPIFGLVPGPISSPTSDK